MNHSVTIERLYSKRSNLVEKTKVRPHATSMLRSASYAYARSAKKELTCSPGCCRRNTVEGHRRVEP